MARHTIDRSEFRESGSDIEVDDVDMLHDENALIYNVSAEDTDETGVVVLTEEKLFASPWIDLHDYDEEP